MNRANLDQTNRDQTEGHTHKVTELTLRLSRAYRAGWIEERVWEHIKRASATISLSRVTTTAILAPSMIPIMG